jgi:DNA processing protein
LTAVALVANCISLVSSAIDVLLPTQAGYPKRLLALGWDKTLHVRGALDDAKPSVAIVGARAASHAAMDRAHAIAKHVAERGVRVVSGGALGIDGAAHRGSLAAPRGATTVVLGSGIDIVYPERHAPLFEEVLDRGGALVSMFRSGMQPRRGTFLQRNPLIAALADVVIVVEAQTRSGSMSTARAALDQGRVLAACPGSPATNRMLAAGYALVENGEDAMAALARKPRVQPPIALDPDAERVRDAIRAGMRDVDSIVAWTGLPVRAVLRALPQLESCLARMP